MITGRIILFSVFLVWLPAFAGADDTAKDAKSVVHIGWLGAFDSGVQIYIGAYERKEPLAEASGPSLERGVATFRVNETLRGPATESLRLPYCYARPLGFTTSSFIWPSLERTKAGELFLLVLIPNGFDPSVISPQDTKAVAMSAQPIKGRDDAPVRHILRLGAAYDAALSRGLAKEVTDLIGETNPGISRFGLQLAVLRAGSRAPDAVLQLLAQEMQSPRHAKDDSELTGLVRFIASRAWRLEDSDPVKKFLFRCLVAMTQSSHQAVTDASLEAMAGLLRPSAQHASHARLLEGLTAPEKGTLRKLMETDSKNPQVREISKWLEQ